GEQMHRVVPERPDGGDARVGRRGVTVRAARALEEGFAGGDGGGAAGEREGRGRRSQEPHEEAEPLDGADGVRRGGAVGVGRGVRRAGELTILRLVALLREQLVGDAHLDVVGLAREEQERLVLRLPPEPRDGPIIAVVVRGARDPDPVRPAGDTEGRLAAGIGGLVVGDGALGDGLDEAGAEHGGRDAEDDVVALTLGPEVLLGDRALARVARVVLPAADHKEGVHASVARSVGVVLVARFADWTVERHEVGYGIARAELGRHGDLRVHGRAGPAERRLRVAPAAAIQVEARAQAFSDAIDLLEILQARLEELELRGGETGQRIAGARGAWANSGVTSWGISPQAS